MKIETILKPERTFCNLSARSKKRVIEDIAIKLAKTIDGIEAEDIFTQLINREKIGSTGIGDCIAIPHCRIDGCNEIIGGLFTLNQPIDFEAIDDKPVDILFVLLVPTKEVAEHLEVLAMLAGKFESSSFRSELIKAEKDDELYDRAVDSTNL
ncbi:MAG: PTS system nitrogen regulatory IIA component [Candidatus Azotimanducaceae bacterium]